MKGCFRPTSGQLGSQPPEPRLIHPKTASLGPREGRPATEHRADRDQASADQSHGGRFWDRLTPDCGDIAGVESTLAVRNADIAGEKIAVRILQYEGWGYAD
jgi:hypothetical protein